MGDWFVNEVPKWVILFIWMGVNIGLFTWSYFMYTDIKFYYLGLMTGPALPIARACANPLNFNCMLILLPVCRNCLSLLRRSAKCCRRNVRRQLDNNISFHICVAYMICLLTAVHYFAHCYNFEYLLQAHNSPNNVTRGLLSALSNLDDPWVNPIRKANTNPMLEVVKSVPGITGAVITLALILMVSAATEVIRRSYFEVFWYTHHLFVIFFIGLVTHGLGGIVRGQTNLDEHDPMECSKFYDHWGEPAYPQCPIPKFAPGGANTWKWVLAPMILYLVERILRFWRSQQKVVITKVVKHPSKVIEVQMKKKGFNSQPGEYIFLHCPSISRLEWHPFTLTSSPQEDYFSVHIRTVGDWTTAFAKACHADASEMQESWTLPSVAVDGPFGTASEDVFRYQVDILVGTGIGVTPFASVIKDMWYKLNDSNFEMKLHKVYFFWICPDTQAFEWFADLLKHMEHQMALSGRADFLEYNIYLTRGWDSNQALNIVTHEDDVYDVITGLRQKTHYGRPNWDQVFSNVAQAHPETSVGVFFCGPKILSDTLNSMSNKHSSSDPKGTHFFFNKENF